MMHSFLNSEDISDIKYDGIPEMYSLDEDFQYERRAIIDVNLEQQMHIQEIPFIVKPGLYFYINNI